MTYTQDVTSDVDNTADDLLRLDNQLCFALHSAMLAMNRLYRPLLTPLGLTYPQYLTMMVLWENDGMIVSELGKRLFIDSATLTPQLKRMQANGLVNRVRSTEDERQVIIYLTDKGKALKEQARAVPESMKQKVACCEEKVAQLRNLLNDLRDELQAQAKAV